MFLALPALFLCVAHARCVLCVCVADEFIRLVGFGNAAGVLADKGFPGLQALKSQAIDLDELVKKGKKL